MPAPSTPAGRPPVRADHIGSLLRPARLRDAFRKRAAGAIDQTAFDAIQDDAIREVVRMQRDCGLAVATDGEFRRGSYWGRFVERTEGLAVRDAVFDFRDDQGARTAFTAPHVVGKVRRGARPIATDEFLFVKPLTDALCKITLPAPSSMHFWRGRAYAEPGLYRDAREFLVDLGRVYQTEITDLAKAGARYVQLDEVALAMLCDPAVREKVSAGGDDPEALVDLYIDAINEAVRGIPSDVVVGVHLCRGNLKGKYLAQGGYDAVAEKLFERAEVNHFLLEYDTGRAGGFAPLRFLPPAKGVVLGLVSSKVPERETTDALRARIEEAARYTDLDRLAISPQCGFASTVAGNPVTEADQWAKLRVCVDTARAVWGSS